MDDEETLTAYHEAGHAVIGYALGARIESVGLYAEADESLPERFGDCLVNWGPVDANADWQIQREILTVLAGPVAEMTYRGEQLILPSVAEWASDWQLAVRLAARLHRDPKRSAQFLFSAVRWLDVHVRETQCWAAIASVSDELLAHEYLDEEQLSDTLAFWVGNHGGRG